MKYTKRGKMIRFFGIIILAAATLIIIFPFYWMVKTSFQSNSSMFQVPPSFFPEVIDISSFYEVLMKKPIVIWMKNSLLVTVSVTLISMVLSTLTAYSLSRYRNKANTIFSFLILTTQMLPSTLFVLPIYREFNRFSLMDTHSGIVIAYTTFALPICIWMLKGYFDSIPTDLEEAATIDGCSRLGTIWRIIMPLSMPGVSTFLRRCCFLHKVTGFLAMDLLHLRENIRLPGTGLWLRPSYMPCRLLSCFYLCRSIWSAE